MPVSMSSVHHNGRSLSRGNDDAPDTVNRGAFSYPSNSDIIRAQKVMGEESLSIDEALRQGVAYGCSDIMIKPMTPVWYKVNGIMFPSDRFEWVSKTDMYNLAMGMVSSVAQASFTQELELDTSYVIQDGRYSGSRFRVSMIRSDDDGVTLVCRYINPVIHNADELGLPLDAMDWAKLPRGLVLVCGPTGSGKSTALAAMIRWIQMNRHGHILTVESPVETVYPHDGLSLVTQREVGLDTLSFKNALKSGMRNAPNVVLVGEMRTNEEIDATIEAADTGHLTMSTLHTKSAEETLLRIMSKFDGEDRRDILARLSSNLVGIMSQQLLQRKDGKGQVAVHEVLKIDRKVKEMVMQGDVLGIHDYMMDNKVSMDHQLLRMVVHNEIKYSEALGHAMDVNEFVELAHGPRLSMLIDYNE